MFIKGFSKSYIIKFKYKQHRKVYKKGITHEFAACFMYVYLDHCLQALLDVFWQYNDASSFLVLHAATHTYKARTHLHVGTVYRYIGIWIYLTLPPLCFMVTIVYTDHNNSTWVFWWNFQPQPNILKSRVPTHALAPEVKCMALLVN